MPRIPWATVRSRLAASWKSGECVTVIGPRGSGKTHLVLELADLSPFVLVLATKRKDPLLAGLREHGYLITSNLSEISWTLDPEGKHERPVHRKVVYWPQFPESLSTTARIKAQAALMKEAMGWIDKTGNWTVIVDETMWMVESLKLETELKEMYFQGRTQGVSVVANAQRPTHVPRLAFSSADYLFLGKTGDRRDIMNLREISSGIPGEVIEQGVKNLDKGAHEFLFVDTKTDSIAVVVAPPR